MKLDPVSITLGKSGTGKSYMRGAVFSIWWLLYKKGTLWTNLPLYIDKIQEYMDKNHPHKKIIVVDRIKLFPKAWVDSCIYSKNYKETKCILDYFQINDIKVSGCHIMIDEAHNFIPRGASAALAFRYTEWCSEIRHAKGTLEFITHNTQKFHKDIHVECQTKIVTDLYEKEYDKSTGIKLYYFYCVIAAWTGKYPLKFVLYYKRQDPSNNRWGNDYKVVKTARPEYFELYDSFSAPVVELDDTSISEESNDDDDIKIDKNHINSIDLDDDDKPWLQYNKITILSWFYSHNREILNNVFLKIFYLVMFFVFIASLPFLMPLLANLMTNGNAQDKRADKTPVKVINEPHVSKVKSRSVVPSYVLNALNNEKKPSKSKTKIAIGDDAGKAKEKKAQDKATKKETNYKKKISELEDRVKALDELELVIFTHIKPDQAFINTDLYKVHDTFSYLDIEYIIKSIDFDKKIIVIHSEITGERKVYL